jgi:hypothetical protein
MFVVLLTLFRYMTVIIVKWHTHCGCTFAESISKFGSGLFLLVQVVLLLDFVHGWNENWVAKDEQFWLVACFCLCCSCASVI